MVNAFFDLCLCFMIISMLTFCCLRKKHEIKARCPRLCLAIGFLILTMFVLIRVNELKGLSCDTVLWTGNIVLNLWLLLGVMRDWVITDVRSNYEVKVQMDATNNSPDNNGHFISCVHSLLNTRRTICFSWILVFESETSMLLSDTLVGVATTSSSCFSE